MHTISLSSVTDKGAITTDFPGCLWIIRFDGSGRAEPGELSDLDPLVQTREGFVWVHMDLTHQRARPAIRRIGALTETARDALCEPVDHQYLEYSDNVMCGALLDRERALSGPTSRTDYFRFAIGDSFLITTRRRPMSSIEATHTALTRGLQITSPLALFVTIVGFLLDELLELTKQVGASFDRAEDLVIDQRGRNARALLGAARRDAVRLSRQIGGLASTLSRLEDIEDASDDHEDRELSETASRLGQHTEALRQKMQSLQERARLLQDELNALLNLETNDRLYVLTVVTTLLLPATFVTGFFGMNLKNLPFAEDDAGLIYVSIICAMASGAVLLLMRRFGLTDPKEQESRPVSRINPGPPAEGDI